MSETDLVSDLKASVSDAARLFPAAADADFRRHLAAAALDFCRLRPRTLVGVLTLVADQAQYSAPALLTAYKSHLWGIAPRAKAKPWEKSYPGPLPTVRLVETGQGPVVRQLQLDPPPSGAQIAVLGAEFRYYYYAAHVIDASAANTSIQAADRALLLLRAQAEIMRELAMRNVSKPLIVREAMGSAPRNGTPTYLYEKLMDEFRAAA